MNLTPLKTSAVALLLMLTPAAMVLGSDSTGNVPKPGDVVRPGGSISDVITQADLDHLLSRIHGRLGGPVNDYNAALHNLDVRGVEHRAAYLAFSKAETELKARRIAGESEDHAIEELAAQVSYYHLAQADLSKMEAAAPRPAQLWTPLVQNPLIPFTYHVTTYTLAREPDDGFWEPSHRRVYGRRSARVETDSERPEEHTSCTTAPNQLSS